MLHISIIARIKTKPDTLVQAQKEMQKIIEPTNSKDKGCLRYELFQDREDHTVFYFMETWESEDCLKTHLESAHLKAYFEAMEGLTESLTITRLTKIG